MTDFSWPVDLASLRFRCTKDKPMPKDVPENSQWMHEGAKVVDQCAMGCCDKYRCEDCGEEWWIECW